MRTEETSPVRSRLLETAGSEQSVTAEAAIRDEMSPSQTSLNVPSASPVMIKSFGREGMAGGLQYQTSIVRGIV